jgi:hypothetical protein
MKSILLFFAILLAGFGSCSPARAVGLTDLKFGQYQIADSQWNVYACTQTTTCQIYSKNPGTAYKIPWWSGQIQWAPGDYIQFISNAQKDPANPWLAVHYRSNGTAIDNMGTGHIINMGPDFFFFVGNDNDTGQLFSMTSGFSDGNGVSWTGTLNPTVPEVNSYASSGSTSPLNPGQSYSGSASTSTGPAQPAPPLYPSYVSIGSGPAGTITIGSSSGPSLPQQANIDIWTNRQAQDGNQIYIQQIGGTNNTVTMTQEGSKNLTRYRIDGNSNAIKVSQGVAGIGQNEIRANTAGDNNSVNLNQARTTDGIALGTNGHYQTVDINGYYNTLITQQTNGGGVGGQYMETTINGNQNTVTAKQTDNGNKVMFTTITGNNNTVDAVQKGTGQHYLETKLTGNGNSVSAVQEGNLANRATLDLTNAGGPASVILQQNGGQNVSVTTTCATAGDCAPITVRQGY